MTGVNWGQTLTIAAGVVIGVFALGVLGKLVGAI